MLMDLQMKNKIKVVLPETVVAGHLFSWQYRASNLEYVTKEETQVFF
jgi:hypothetical protein